MEGKESINKKVHRYKAGVNEIMNGEKWWWVTEIISSKVRKVNFHMRKLICP